MGAPQVPIDVDPKTGVWTSDGLPMIYLPRHFFINNHRAVEQALGRERYAEILFQAGHFSAYQWCAKTAPHRGLGGLDVFHLYLRRLSQRGWGQFAVLEVDEEAARARIRIDHSVFLLEPGADGSTDGACYMFAGWPAGALEWVREEGGQRGRILGAETACRASGAEHCVLEAWPA